MPPLVIGGAQDSRSPIECAQETAMIIPGAALLLSEHHSQGALLHGSQCVHSHIFEYLSEGTLPEAGARCAAPETQ
jgi:hypothetical protein